MEDWCSLFYSYFVGTIDSLVFCHIVDFFIEPCDAHIFVRKVIFETPMYSIFSSKYLFVILTLCVPLLLFTYLVFLYKSQTKYRPNDIATEKKKTMMKMNDVNERRERGKITPKQRFSRKTEWKKMKARRRSKPLAKMLGFILLCCTVLCCDDLTNHSNVEK